MKSLQEHIIENLINIFEISKEEKITALNDFIKTANDNAINSLYNTIKKYSLSKDKFNKWIESKMVGKPIDQIKMFKQIIYSLCENPDYYCYNEISKLLQDQLDNVKEPNPFINFGLSNNNNQYIIKYEINKIKQYYSEHYNIPEKFWVSLLNSTASGQPEIGKGEFLLMLVSKSQKESKGDVNIDGTGVEVKYLANYEARIGNSDKCDATAIFIFLNKIVDKLNNSIPKIYHQTISLNSKINENLLNLIKVVKHIESDDAFILQDVLKDNLCKSTITNDSIITKDICNKTIESLIKLKNEDNATIISEFVKIFTVLYVKLYCQLEKSQYLCIIDKNYDFNFVNIDKLEIDSDFPFFRIRYSGQKNSIFIKY